MWQPALILRARPWYIPSWVSVMLGFKIWKVTGHSMAPKIPENSYILANRWLRHLPVKKGQMLVMEHKVYGLIVKTVAIVDRNGFIWSKGENTDSISVEQLGPSSKEQVLGRVIGIFKPN